MPSVIFFTVHKAASSFYGGRVLSPLARHLKLARLNPESAAYTDGQASSNLGISRLCDRQNVVLGPVRTPEGIENIEAFDTWKKIVSLRDPRDVLVSLFYSIALSHPVPPGERPARQFLARRMKAREKGLDAFTLAHTSHAMRLRYNLYADNFLDRPNVLLIRYEDTVSDWPATFDRITNFIGEPVRKTWRLRMHALQSELRVTKEDPGAHKRQITPGDGIRKFKPETIARLNEMFHSPMRKLGYLA